MTSLDVKLVTTVSSSDSVLPEYLVHILVYFFLKTSKFIIQLTHAENYKMARQLTKHRRFVADPRSVIDSSARGSKAAPPTMEPALKSFT